VQGRAPIIRLIDCHVAREGNQGYEFLLLRRASGRVYAGDWRMVAGKLEAGEAAWQACLRELREETELVPLRLLAVPYVNRFYEWEADRINDIPVFVAVTGQVEPVLDSEHSEHRWLSPAHALPLLPWPGQRDGLRAAHRLLTEDLALQRHLEIELQTA